MVDGAARVEWSEGGRSGGSAVLGDSSGEGESESDHLDALGVIAACETVRPPLGRSDDFDGWAESLTEAIDEVLRNEWVDVLFRMLLSGLSSSESDVISSTSRRSNIETPRERAPPNATTDAIRSRDARDNGRAVSVLEPTNDDVRSRTVACDMRELVDMREAWYFPLSDWREPGRRAGGVLPSSSESELLAQPSLLRGPRVLSTDCRGVLAKLE